MFWVEYHIEEMGTGDNFGQGGHQSGTVIHRRGRKTNESGFWNYIENYGKRECMKCRLNSHSRQFKEGFMLILDWGRVTEGMMVESTVVIVENGPNNVIGGLSKGTL